MIKALKRFAQELLHSYYKVAADWFLISSRKGNIMKNKLSVIIGIILLCATVVFTCTGCKSTSAYAVEIVSGTDETEIDSATGASDMTVTIGNSSYDVKWRKSVRSDYDDKLYEWYDVIDSADNFLPGSVKIDPETGEIVDFNRITPFSRIDNISSLSDEELKSAAEQRLGNLADFSRYNFFEVTRPLGIVGTNTDTTLSWQVKRDILCNISVTVYISEDGEIYCFGKTDVCPDGTAESYIPKDDRIKLLEGKICEHLKIRSLDGSGYKYNILHERLSYYHNKVCVTYVVKILDKQDFAHVISVRVCKP